MTDDQGYGDAGYMGHPVLKTPALDEMAASSLRFSHFYAAAPVCSPTRGSFLTGRHPNRFGCFQFGNAIRPQEDTLARALKRAGYTTGHFGKWHVGSLVPGDVNTPGAMGFDEWASAWNFYDLDPWLSVNGKPQQFKGEGSMVTIDHTLEFIQRSAKKNEPFLAVVWFGNPHDPHITTDELRALYPDQPPNLQNYYGEISGIDRAMGKLRRRLSEWRLADNTLLLFTSDNGGARPQSSNGDLRGAKGTLYEGGLRVPALVEWRGQITSRATAFTGNTSDLYATVLDLAKATPLNAETPLDGISLVPLFEGQTDERPSPMGFWSYPAQGQLMWSDKNLAAAQQAQQTSTNPDVPRGLLNPPTGNYPEADKLPGPASWIDGAYKLHRLPKKDGTATYQLFDLNEDPKEERDILKDHPEEVQKLSKDLEAWQRSVLRSLRGEDYK